VAPQQDMGRKYSKKLMSADKDREIIYLLLSWQNRLDLGKDNSINCQLNLAD